MTHSTSHNAQPLFDEIAIADLGPFQIAVLTQTTLVNRRIFSHSVPVPKRHYQSQGWLIHSGKLIAHLNALTIGHIFPKDSPFRPIQRLAPSIPISFEVNTSQPLPAQVSAHATFSCTIPAETEQLPKSGNSANIKLITPSTTHYPYYSIFRQVKPRFVRVYALAGNGTVLSRVEQMLTEEALFLNENHQQIKQTPFYKGSFGL